MQPNSTFGPGERVTEQLQENDQCAEFEIVHLNLILAVSEHVGIVHVYYELIRRTVNAMKLSHFWTPVQIGQSFMAINSKSRYYRLIPLS